MGLKTIFQFHLVFSGALGGFIWYIAQCRGSQMLWSRKGLVRICIPDMIGGAALARFCTNLFVDGQYEETGLAFIVGAFWRPIFVILLPRTLSGIFGLSKDELNPEVQKMLNESDQKESQVKANWEKEMEKTKDINPTQD